MNMKLSSERPYADPESAARKLVELTASIAPVQDGHIHSENINAPFLSNAARSPTRRNLDTRSCNFCIGFT